MGEVEERIGADYLRLLAAKQRLSVLDSELKKMIGNLNLAVSLAERKRRPDISTTTAPTMSTTAPISGIAHRQLTLPTVEELGKIVEYRKQAKEEVDSLNKQFKELEARLVRGHALGE